MTTYLITKVYRVEAASPGEALRILHIAAREGEDWIFQHEPDAVKKFTTAGAVRWLTVLRAHLFGRRRERREDPRSVVL